MSSLPAAYVQDAINKAVASAGKTTGVATKKAVNFAKLANRGGSMLTDFDTGARRHLLQDNAAFQRSDRIQVANLAAEVGWGRSDCMCKITWPAHAPE
jgi:hypothetical protein